MRTIVEQAYESTTSPIKIGDGAAESFFVYDLQEYGRNWPISTGCGRYPQSIRISIRELCSHPIFGIGHWSGFGSDSSSVKCTTARFFWVLSLEGLWELLGESWNIYFSIKEWLADVWSRTTPSSTGSNQKLSEPSCASTKMDYRCSYLWGLLRLSSLIHS